jgi:acyl-CoA thioester hydrolase
MYIFSAYRRVNYAETDKMGYLYYGRYADYYETGRVESLRALGFVYKEMENSGIMMPVVEMQTKYKRPAFYDDILEVKTIMTALPSVRIYFEYEIYNEEKELINQGKTTLVFFDMEKQRPCDCPADLKNKLREFF